MVIVFLVWVVDKKDSKKYITSSSSQALVHPAIGKPC